MEGRWGRGCMSLFYTICVNVEKGHLFFFIDSAHKAKLTHPPKKKDKQICVQLTLAHPDSMDSTTLPIAYQSIARLSSLQA